MKPVAWYCPCDPDLHTAFRWHFDYVDRSNEHCEMCGKLLIALHTADQLREVEQQRDELLAALESALEIVTTDRCDGDSAFASGVNAACERHAIGIRNLIDKVKK